MPKPSGRPATSTPPILRDTYSSGSHVKPPKEFYLTDTNYNINGLVKCVGIAVWGVAERYTYTPYGVVTYRNPHWTSAGSSANSIPILYTGRTLDPRHLPLLFPPPLLRRGARTLHSDESNHL